jgi:uncharacterized membrane protein YphA (DoxX/SURF4 family)
MTGEVGLAQKQLRSLPKVLMRKSDWCFQDFILKAEQYQHPSDGEKMNASSKLKTTGIWIASGLLAALFLLTGIPKLIGAEGWLRHFARWGYPDWLRLVVGIVEVASAVLLLVPRLATLGACGLVMVMAGATYTHLFRAPDEAGRAVITLVLLLVAVVIGYVRRPSSAGIN